MHTQVHPSATTHGGAPSAQSTGACQLADMHCHLDFAGNLPDLLAAAATRGVAAFSTTVTPHGYEAALRRVADLASPGAPANSPVRIGLGLHPWWLADGTCTERDVARFAELASTTRYIGEVGLDFAPRREGTFDAQVAAFERVLEACASGGKVLSIHAVRSASTVLDLLERHRTLSGNACILHWFSGTGDELARAVRLGCHFSVGTRMLATKRGRAYARQLPPERLLLETDLPDDPTPTFDPQVWLDDLAQALGLLEAAASRPLANTIAHTSRELLEL